MALQSFYLNYQITITVKFIHEYCSTDSFLTCIKLRFEEHHSLSKDCNPFRSVDYSRH